MEGFSLNQDRGSMQDALKQYKLGLGTFEQKMPLMGRKFNEFTEQCFAGNSLTEREKQLIALGIAINAQDEYCMIYHTKGCLDEGATEENILEAVSVAAAFGGEFCSKPRCDSCPAVHRGIWKHYALEEGIFRKTILILTQRVLSSHPMLYQAISILRHRSWS